jgi:large subunit ribosomal protein L15
MLRKKNTRMRGKTTHGFGSMKKNRGAGHRGGRGNAGSGKRADVKKPSYWKNKKYFGKHGFKTHRTKIIAAVNISELESRFDEFKSKNLVEEKDGLFILDLNKLGYQKLLGTGTPSRKYRITANFSSGKASEKIKGAGGDVSVPKED